MVTVQPLIDALPAVTLTFATNPPDQELDTLYAAEQDLVPEVADTVGRADDAVALGLADREALAEGLADRLALGLAAVGDGPVGDGPVGDGPVGVGLVDGG